MNTSTDKERVRALLERYALEYNVPEFAANDPVQFARHFPELPDREIASLLVSTISWGRRPMILRNAEKLLALLGGEPFRFVTEGDIEALPEDNIHRTFFGRHLKYYLRGLRTLYRRYGTLENFARAIGAAGDGTAPAWTIAESLGALLSDANAEAGVRLDGPDRCLPSKPSTSALKRLNMALRWLVRRDGIVDPGGWELFGPERLYIPMDVHVCNTSAALGLLPRAPRTPDRKTAVALTETLRAFRPDDPTIYDFALFGIGVNGEAAALDI